MLLPDTKDDAGKDEWYAGEWTIFTGALKVVQEGNWQLMQCTGLKDKNGKLIYEGDIMSWKAGTIWQIKWKYGGFWLWQETGYREYWADPNSTGGGREFRSLQDEIEIIGNIYENPDLLKE